MAHGMRSLLRGGDRLPEPAPRQKYAVASRAPAGYSSRPGEVVEVPRSDCVVLSRSGTPTTSPTAQFEQLDLRRREHADRHAYHADPVAHVQLAGPSLEVPQHVLGDQTSRRPPDQGQVEVAAVDVARQRERDAAQGG